jgi:hypothetical protein
MSRPYVIPESTTEVFYPVSKRRIRFDSKGNVVSDTAKDKEKDRQ